MVFFLSTSWTCAKSGKHGHFFKHGHIIQQLRSDPPISDYSGTFHPSTAATANTEKSTSKPSNTRTDKNEFRPEQNLLCQKISRIIILEGTTPVTLPALRAGPTLCPSLGAGEVPSYATKGGHHGKNRSIRGTEHYRNQ